jgi:tRNA A37 threonylcarbamoyladenosine synthetase subunit TsaC/SUA5/YrdC
VQAKYQRLYWRDLSLDEVITRSSLRSVVLEWAQHQAIITASEKKIIEQELGLYQRAVVSKKIPFFNKKDDFVSILNGLLAGNIVIIPNEKIYVMFGVDDDCGSYSMQAKINTEKLRHPLMPLAELSSLEKLKVVDFKTSLIKNFCLQLIKQFQPIGLLLPEKDSVNTKLHIFYPGFFFEKLRRSILKKKSEISHIYVSSANLTTTGAHTTAEGVMTDFGYSQVIAGVVNDGDLKRNYEINNSSTIIEYVPERGLSYFRVGYPSQTSIDNFAKNFGVVIMNAPHTRQSLVR